ncbi:uncharacterized protein TNCV_3118381 [Trichonephila clavipes]|uniref:Uncharacterized protein n=1 Tax=Trichonephila clavipes TaxID=2585209 RepID=A0A8X7BGV4_TRICX|nr:uncharacterized protein TNCV_3118381 [Trichonephila clavipes]
MFYDPLGLFTPVTVIVKILFQDTRLSGIKWDELLPPAVVQQWHKWINDLQCMNDIHIPRWIGFSETSDITIHVFCDASERAYGYCLYTRHTVDTFTEANIICSRKKRTCTLTHSFAMERFNCSFKLDTERDPNRWKTFVFNRTTEIPFNTLLLHNDDTVQVQELGRELLNEKCLSTVLIGIEAALNSRPLVYKEERDDNSAALTPAHFLTG